MVLVTVYRIIICNILNYDQMDSIRTIVGYIQAECPIEKYDEPLTTGKLLELLKKALVHQENLDHYAANPKDDLPF